MWMILSLPAFPSSIRLMVPRVRAFEVMPERLVLCRFAADCGALSDARVIRKQEVEQ